MRPWLRPVILAIVALLAGPGRPVAGQEPPTAQPPLAITSCGQSTDAFALSLLCRRARLDHVYNATMAPEGLRGVRTLIVVVGSSLKGLAEAGLTERGEAARVEALLSEARATGVTTIGVHIGGEPRRGAVSNRFITLILGRVDVLVISQSGNKDGIFTQASRRFNIPLISVAQPAEVVRELKAYFLSQDRRP